MAKKIRLSYSGDDFKFNFETTQNCNDFEALSMLTCMLKARFVQVEKAAQRFDVILTHGGQNKIGVIKVVRELTQLGLTVPPPPVNTFREPGAMR